MGLIAHAIELILKSEKADEKKGDAELVRQAELDKITKENDFFKFTFDDFDDII